MTRPAGEEPDCRTRAASDGWLNRLALNSAGGAPEAKKPDAPVRAVP
jgi:hypothetical protein